MIMETGTIMTTGGGQDIKIHLIIMDFLSMFSIKIMMTIIIIKDMIMDTEMIIIITLLIMEIMDIMVIMDMISIGHGTVLVLQFMTNLTGQHLPNL